MFNMQNFTQERTPFVHILCQEHNTRGN